MRCNRGRLTRTLTLCLLLSSSYPFIGQRASKEETKAETKKGDHDEPVDLSRLQRPVLWHDPGSIGSLDLFYGQGGRDGQPAGPFKFDSEDMHGTNPKFDVHDARGTKWRVKLGDEAQPEVVASRLLWAVGYFVEDDYLLPTAEIESLHIERGSKLAQGWMVKNARFARKPQGQSEIGMWRWKQSPFSGTREFNGLRVMMAVINNWDLKDENNSVFEDKKSGESIFITRDIGATFGTNGVSWSKDRSKGDVATYEKSKFITHKSGAQVDFATPAAPDLLTAPNVEQYEMRRGLEWIGKDIPITDARWIGSLLKQLSHQQLVDAFRAGHFPPKEVESYVKVIERRIQELAVL